MISGQQAWYQGWAVTRKTFPGHRGRPGQQGGSLPREAGEQSAKEAIKQYVPSANRKTFDMNEGLSKAKDEFHSRADIFMYNASTSTLLIGALGAGDDHSKIQQRYAKGQDFDKFVKMRWSKGKLRIYLDRVKARSETDAWDKSFEAAKVIQACGFPDDTVVRLVKGKEGTELELGGI